MPELFASVWLCASMYTLDLLLRATCRQPASPKQDFIKRINGVIFIIEKKYNLYTS